MIKIELFLLVFVGIFLLSFLLITSKTQVGNLSSFVVRSGSMEPLIHTGSLILVEKQQQYSLGDIITFQINDEMVTHRIVRMLGTGPQIQFYTKGDANEIEDKSPVELAEIKGLLVFSIPMIGRLVMVIKTPLGFIGLIMFPAILFIGFEIWNLRKEILVYKQRHLQEKSQHLS